jgi:hypothetical protein
MTFCIIESGPHRGQPELARYELYSTIFGSTSAKYQIILEGHTYTRELPVKPPNHPTIWGSAYMSLVPIGASRNWPDMSCIVQFSAPCRQKYQSIPDGHTYTRGHPVRPPNHPTLWGSA